MDAVGRGDEADTRLRERAPDLVVLDCREPEAAVADPTRQQMLDLILAAGDATATALAHDLPITRQGVAKHLAVLERAGDEPLLRAAVPRARKLMLVEDPEAHQPILFRGHRRQDGATPAPQLGGAPMPGPLP